MDQLKDFLAVCKKQHFWILCGFAGLIGLIVFFISQSKLQKAYTERYGEFKAASSGLAPLLGGQPHPNNDWVTKIHQIADEVRKQVYDSWTRLYGEQAKDVYVWPPVFANAFSRPPGTVDSDTMQALCEQYPTYVKKTALPGMAKLVDAEWLGAPEDANAGSGGPRGGPRIGAGGPRGVTHDDTPHAVEWAASDQLRLYEDYNWQDRPSELDVRYAQEELWVMQAIFETIAAANKKNVELVREIDQTLIGYDATNKFPLGEGENRIIHFSKQTAPVAGGFTPMTGAPNMGGPQGAGAAPLIEPKRPVRQKGEPGGSGGTGGSGGVPPMFDRRQFGGGGRPAMNGPAGPGGAATDAPDPDAYLKDGRYVDAKGRPLTAADLQNTGEYRLMAFRIRLVANQAQFQKVIEEFSNSALPLEVREVRVNPPLGQQNDMEGGPREGRHRRGAANPGAVIHNVTLEIDGVAYLLNPPDPKTVGLTDVPAATPAAGPPATIPAATTPAATTPTAAPAPTPSSSATTTPTDAPASTPAATTPAVAPPAATPPATTPATPAAPAGVPVTAPK